MQGLVDRDLALHKIQIQIELELEPIQPHMGSKSNPNAPRENSTDGKGLPGLVRTPSTYHKRSSQAKGRIFCMYFELRRVLGDFRGLSYMYF